MKNHLERVILADPESSSWDFANSIYQQVKKMEEQEKELNFTLGEIRIKRFPDGECEPVISKNSRSRHVIFIHDSSKNPYQWWVELMLVNDALRRGSAERITNVLPYMRWTREEKKDKPHIPIGSKVMADTLNLPCLGSRADRIITMDLHASAMQGFFNIPIDVLNGYSYAAEKIRGAYPNISNNLVVVAPDLGSIKRARDVAEILGVGFAGIDKDRLDGETVRANAVIGEVKDRACLLIDDIFSKGSTQDAARKALIKVGAVSVIGYATHFIGVGNYHDNLKGFDAFYTTDTFYHTARDLEGISVISVAPLIGEAVYRAEKGDSISELFKAPK